MNDFRSIRIMVRYGDILAIAGAVLALVFATRSRENGERPSLLRAVLLSLAVGLGIKNATDVERLVADTLMPR